MTIPEQLRTAFILMAVIVVGGPAFTLLAFVARFNALPEFFPL